MAVNSVTTKTDAELIAEIRHSADEDSFRLLVKRHYGPVYNRAYFILGDWSEAQDVVQEALVRACLNLDQLKEPEKFSAWLNRIVFFSCMMTIRSSHPELYRSEYDKENFDLLSSLEDQDSPTPEQHALSAEMSVVVRSAINNLPWKYQLPLKLFHLDGFSYKKIARLLNIPLGTVQSLISRAKKQLKPALHSYSNNAFFIL